MRVVGVTTSLPLDELVAAGPDAIFPAIADVSLKDVTSLRWADQQQAAAAAAAVV